MDRISDERRAQMRERYYALNPRKCKLKECSRCHRLLQPGSVNFGNQGKNAYCKTCGEAASAANREKARALAAIPERPCSKCGVVLPNTLEHFYKDSRGVCKGCAKEQVARYAKANPAVLRASRNNRRARKRAAGGTFGKADVQAKLAHQKNACYWCKAPLDGTYHVDHVIPLSRGGSNGPGNIVCACSTCNLSKASKMPWEFAARLF